MRILQSLEVMLHLKQVKHLLMRILGLMKATLQLKEVKHLLLSIIHNIEDNSAVPISDHYRFLNRYPKCGNLFQVCQCMKLLMSFLP